MKNRRDADTGPRRLAEIEALLRAEPLCLSGLCSATGLKEGAVRRYLNLLRGKGVPIRVVEWRKDRGPFALVPYYKAEPGLSATKRGAAVDDASAPDIDIERLISKENARKAALIKPRRDPMTIMFFGEYVK